MGVEKALVAVAGHVIPRSVGDIGGVPWRFGGLWLQARAGDCILKDIDM